MWWWSFALQRVMLLIVAFFFVLLHEGFHSGERKVPSNLRQNSLRSEDMFRISFFQQIEQKKEYFLYFSHEDYTKFYKLHFMWRLLDIIITSQHYCYQWYIQKLCWAENQFCLIWWNLLERAIFLLSDINSALYCEIPKNHCPFQCFHFLSSYETACSMSSDFE